MSDKFENKNTSLLNDNISFFLIRFLKIIGIHKLMFGIIFLITAILVLVYYLNQPVFYNADYDVFYNETMREFVDDGKISYVDSDFDKNFWLKAMESDDVFEIVKQSSGFTYTVPQLKQMFSVLVFNKRKEDRIPVFRVSIVSQNRKHIPILIRTYVLALNQMLIEHRIENSRNLITYLQDQINDKNAQLSQMNIKLMSGALEGNTNEIIDFDKIKSRVDLFRKELLQAKVNLASIKAARERTELELENLDGTIVNESAFTEPLKVQLLNLELDLSRALTKNKEGHPAVKQIRQNIAHVKEMLNDSLSQRMEIKSLVQNPLKGQLMSKLLDLKISEVSESTKVESLEQIIKELENRTLPNAINEEHQRQLRNREMVSLSIKQLNDKLIEAQSVTQGSLSRFVFIDDANSIFVFNKSVYFYIALAILLGLVVASFLVFVYDLLDDRIIFIEDYKRFYRTPLLGTVKHYQTDQLSDGSDFQTDEYHLQSDMGSLIVNFKMFLRKNKKKSVVITSPDRGEGKSLISFRTAAALAEKQYKVLLVDMDFFSPKLSERFNLKTSKGISNYLAEEVSISDTITHTDIENLDVVSAGTSSGKKEHFYSNPLIGKYIEEVSDDYDVILFDTPAGSFIPDIIDFFDLVDHVLVVVRLRKTTRALLDRFFDYISGYKKDQMHVLVNDVMRNKKKSQYYGYDYYVKEENKSER